MMATKVRQCPRCECRFLDEWELKDHLATDHGVDGLAHVFERSLECTVPH